MAGASYLWRGSTDPDRVADVTWRPLAVADLNGGHQPDLVWQHLATQAGMTWYLKGPPLLDLLDSVWLSPPQLPAGWRIVGTYKEVP